MWAPMWPDVRRGRSRRSTSVTNGVHVPTWIARDLANLFATYLGADWLERHDDPALWDGVLAIPDEELWAVRAGAAALSVHLRPRARAAALDRRARRHAARRRRRHAARPGCADDRLRAPLHRLQAAGADLPRSRTAGAHPQRRRPAGADHLRRQVASGRRHRQAPPAARLPARARSAVRRPRRLRRRLRPARRALPRAGLRRLAEQPAQAARGERHQRHEGGDQRRAAPEHRRRLVGRRLQRRERLGDRRRRAGDNHDAVDAADAAALYRLLEEEVVPAFYDRDRSNVPRRWLAVVKEAIRSVAPRFSARRMVKEYVERMYAPALEQKAWSRK